MTLMPKPRAWSRTSGLLVCRAVLIGILLLFNLSDRAFADFPMLLTFKLTSASNVPKTLGDYLSSFPSKDIRLEMADVNAISATFSLVRIISDQCETDICPTYIEEKRPDGRVSSVTVFAGAKVYFYSIKDAPEFNLMSGIDQSQVKVSFTDAGPVVKSQRRPCETQAGVDGRCKPVHDGRP